MSPGVYTCASSYLLPVEQLLQLGVQQLWSKKVQEYPYTLHPTPEVAHTSKGQLKHHLNDTDPKAPNVMEHVLKPKRPAKQDGVHSFCSLSHAWQTEAVPVIVTGRAFNHAPDSLQDAARKRALCIGLDESVNYGASPEEAAAEAKKAEGASCTALRIPSPPRRTGKVDCVQEWSFSASWILKSYRLLL
eukprot:Em0642g1a